MKRSTHTYRRKNEAGVALLLALLFVAILAAIVTDFMYKMQVEATLVAAQNSNHEGYLAAKSGIATGISVLHADRLNDIDEEGSVSGMYDGLDEPWAQKGVVTSFNDDVVNITMSDEYGKINLNALIYEDRESGREVEHPVLVPLMRELFLGIFELEEDPTDVILDWLDADDEERLNGAESSYYEGLETPFGCKNGPMDSIEELLLLPGISPELYFGLPPEGEEDLYDDEMFDDEEEEFPPGQKIPLFDLFTVHGHPEGKLNANTLPIAFELEPLILDYFSQYVLQYPLYDLKPSSGNVIEEKRSDEFPFFASEADLQNVGLAYTIKDPGSSGGDLPRQIFTTQSNVFRIWSDGQSGDAQVRIEAFVFRDPADNTTAQEPQLFRTIDWRVVR